MEEPLNCLLKITLLPRNKDAQNSRLTQRKCALYGIKFVRLESKWKQGISYIDCGQDGCCQLVLNTHTHTQNPDYKKETAG